MISYINHDNLKNQIESEFQTKIDIEQVIDTSNFIFSSSELLCNICYCVLQNPKKCYNKKCKAICCDQCIKKAKKDNTPCPFCKFKTDYMEYISFVSDDSFLFMLQNIRLICKHLNCKEAIFTFNEYMKHILNYKNDIIHSHEPNNKYHWYQNKLCSYCKKREVCKDCENEIRYDNNFKYMCEKCELKYENTNYDSISSNSYNYKCNICDKSIIQIYNPFKTTKCEICKYIVCSNCSRMCIICKRYICLQDFIYCDYCKFSYINSCQCKQCFKKYSNISMFIKCNKCNKKHCINCVKSCNACKELICAENNNYKKCNNCELYSCDKHCFTCVVCDPNYTVCLKKCTFTCEICYIKSTLNCKKQNHPIISIANNTCQHQICSKCISKCSLCEKEICQFCYKQNTEETQNIYKCNFCDNYICKSCKSFCYNCSKNYCKTHNCLYCKNKIEQCYYCYSKDIRDKCQLCDKDIDICNDCKRLSFCSNSCYVKYSQINKENRNIHICEMFLCNSCREKNQSIIVNDDLIGSLFEEVYNKNKGKNKKKTDKVTVHCQESCLCSIY